MASVNDFGGAYPDTLGDPPLGGPTGWAAAVAAAFNNRDETVDDRIAEAFASEGGTPWAEVSGGVATTYTGDGINGDLGRLYRVYTFLNDGVLTLVTPGKLEVLLVGGGGPGGADHGGGGGGGEVRSTTITLTTPGTYPVDVGAGGICGTARGVYGAPGSNTTFGGLTALGGGRGGQYNNVPGGPGACGGGGPSFGGGAAAGASSKGFNGAAGNNTGAGGGGGMGGDAGVGQQSNGGPGLESRISGIAKRYGAGGGGADGTGFGHGGAGGGGDGNTVAGGPTAGAANTGSGGGGNTSTQPGRDGGSGIVIVRTAEEGELLVEIDDTTASPYSTYSSAKIEELIDEVDTGGGGGGGSEINDAVTADDSTWSSEKIAAEIAAEIEDAIDAIPGGGGGGGSGDPPIFVAEFVDVPSYSLPADIFDQEDADDFFLIFEALASVSSADIFGRLRVDGVDVTMTNYLTRGTVFGNDGGSSSVEASGTNNRFGIGWHTGQNRLSSWSMDVTAPMLARPTLVYSHGPQSYSQSATAMLDIKSACIYNAATLVDSMTFYPSSGLISGRVKVYKKLKDVGSDSGSGGGASIVYSETPPEDVVDFWFCTSTDPDIGGRLYTAWDGVWVETGGDPGGGGDPGAGGSSASYYATSIPVMTAPTVPSGVAAASSEYNPASGAWAGMNPTPNGWLNNGSALPAWISYQYPTTKRAIAYGFRAWFADTYPARTPNAWKFQGSNDGTTWTDLDTRSGFVPSSAVQVFVFPLDIVGDFTRYRMLISANNGNAYTGLARFSIFTEEDPKAGVFALTDPLAPVIVRVE